MPCKHYIIEGRVQGVFFRASTCDKAIETGLTGWVRNLPDGRVEAVACGDQRQLEILESWLETGPPMASVSRVMAEDWQESDFDDFSIR